MTAPLRQSRTLQVSIARSAQDVYAFIADPRNLPQWASGLGTAVDCAGRDCVLQMAQGPAQFRFAPCNEFGVLDHYVSPQPGVEVYVPMRVVPNGVGSEVLFTLFRQPEMDDAAFRRDAAWVQRDLAALKTLLEDEEAAAYQGA